MSAFFSASETALFSIPREQIPSFEKSENAALRRVFWLLSRGQQTLIVILVANLAINIITVGIVDNIVNTFIPNGGVWVTLLAATGALLIFGEILPKNLAVGHSHFVSKLASFPLYYISMILSPVIKLLQIFNTFLIALFSRYLRTPSPFVTEKELFVSFEKSVKDGTISDKEYSLLDWVISAGHKSVATAIVHRSEILFVQKTDSIFTAKEKMVKAGYWFCAISNEDVDKVDGFLFLEDIERFNPKVDRPLFYEKGISLPNTMEIADVAIIMKEQAQRVAAIQDEFGSVVGVVTLKKVIASIMPADESCEVKSELSEKNRVFDGKQELIEINDWIPESLKLEATKHRTLNGLITGHLGRIPNKEEEFAIDESIFYIIDADGRVVSLIRIEREI
jgi:CBS domain containing-hemolysin-like protein